jgi:hypothetical protein
MLAAAHQDMRKEFGGALARMQAEIDALRAKIDAAQT